MAYRTARAGDEGWGFPPSARKAHFILTDGRSICGRIGFAFELPLDPPDAAKATDDCAECRRRYEKREAAKA